MLARLLIKLESHELGLAQNEHACCEPLSKAVVIITNKYTNIINKMKLSNYNAGLTRLKSGPLFPDGKAHRTTFVYGSEKLWL